MMRGALAIRHLFVDICYNGFMVKKSTKKQDSSKKELDLTNIKSNSIDTRPAPDVLVNNRRNAMPVILRLALAVCFIGIMSALFTWFIFVRHESYDTEAVLEFINEKPYLFAYSVLIIFLSMLILASLTWTVFFSTGLSFVIISIVSYIDMTKFEIRDIPLLPEDFLLAGSVGELTSFVDVWEIVRLVLGVLLIIVGSALLERCARRTVGRNRKNMPWWERYAVPSRVCFSLVFLVTFLFVAEPVVRQENYDWLEGMELTLWNPVLTYSNNGFIIGFLSNIAKLDQAKPDSYSEEEMQRIASKYRELKAADTSRKPAEDVIDNLVIVLDETFYDPEIYEKYEHFGGDVIPEVHAIFEEYPSGYMYSPEYGGGTANIEFEVFTGLSNYWARNYPYVNSLTRVDNVLSAASWLKGFDFTTTAIHSYDGSLYKRNIVYPRMGFDDFIDQSRMKYTDKENSIGYISDQSLFREVLSVIKMSDEPQMIGAITMQNHSPYNTAVYPDLHFVLKDSADQFWDLANSFQSLHSADAYIGEFLDELDKLNERTVVLLFGDHTAGILSEYVNSSDQTEQRLAHLTPFFIYSNFELDTDLAGDESSRLATTKLINQQLGFDLKTKGVDLPIMTPNCLLNTVYNLLGIEKPALFYLLDTVCMETPILTSGYFAGDDPEETEALHDYMLVNYDILSGGHYWDGR